MNAKTIEKAINPFVCALLMFVLAGCISPGPQRSSRQLVPVGAVDQINAIDAEIAKEQRQISDHRSLINQWYLDLWKVEKGGPATSRGGISQNGPVDVEHEIIRLQGDIAALYADVLTADVDFNALRDFNWLISNS